jgi:phosphate-selective porin OprO and OprP
MQLFHTSSTRKRAKWLALGAFITLGAAHAEIPVETIGSHTISFEGMFQLDADYFSNRIVTRSGVLLTPARRTSNTLMDDTGLRRAELVLLGKSGNLDWALGYDAQTQRWLDASVRFKFSSSSVRLGQFKQPSGLEELTSTRNNDFVAKSLSTSAFALGRRLGVSYTLIHPLAHAAGGEWSLTGAAFTRELTNNTQKANGYAVRATIAPWLEPTADAAATENALHLGLSAVRYTPSKDTVRVAVRPEADFANLRLIDSLNLTDARSATQFGLEAAYFNGPFKLVGEYVSARYARRSNPDYSANSASVSAVYNLSGQRFAYAGGLYKTPASSQDQWQLAARYSTLDANDGAVLGGKEHNLTLGVNWYFRKNVKFMGNVNQVQSTRLDIENDPAIVELRVQMML